MVCYGMKMLGQGFFYLYEATHISFFSLLFHESFGTEFCNFPTSQKVDNLSELKSIIYIRDTRKSQTKSLEWANEFLVSFISTNSERYAHMHSEHKVLLLNLPRNKYYSMSLHFDHA